MMIMVMTVMMISARKPLALMMAGQQKEAVLAKPPHLKVHSEEFLSVTVMMMQMLMRIMMMKLSDVFVLILMEGVKHGCCGEVRVRKVDSQCPLRANT